MVNRPQPQTKVLSALRQVHALARLGAVQLTSKAIAEMALLEPPADAQDIVAVLLALGPNDCAQRLTSAITGEPLWVFLPLTPFGRLYVKLAIRRHCVVISFHEQVDP